MVLCLVLISILGGEKRSHQEWDACHQLQITTMEIHPLLITHDHLLEKVGLLHVIHLFGQQIYGIA